MSYRASFCDPFKPDIIELGRISKSQIMDTFEKIPWTDLLYKMDSSKKKDFHYSPSFEVENITNKNGVIVSAIDRNEWSVFYKRPKKSIRQIGHSSRKPSEKISDIEGQTIKDVRECIQALLDNDLNFLEKKIGAGDKRINHSIIQDSLNWIKSPLAMTLPVVGIFLLYFGVFSPKVESSIESILYIGGGIILMIWGNRIPFLSANLAEKRRRKNRTKEIQQLKRNGELVKVLTSEIKVIGNTREIVVEAVHPRNVFGLFIGIIRGTNPAHDVVDFEGTSFLKCKKKIGRRTYEFQSDPINKQAKTVKIQLGDLKYLNLYIDKNDTGKYYFDNFGL